MRARSLARSLSVLHVAARIGEDKSSIRVKFIFYLG